jgi:hypothetical protein
MQTITYGSTLASRAAVVDYLQEQRLLNPDFSVVDVGGMGSSWSESVRDHVIDIQAEGEGAIVADICSWTQWEQLWEAREGRPWDYAICTHTLEDLYDPFTALYWLPRIARQGIISMPSALAELSSVESPAYRGYMHHRWLWIPDQEGVCVVPKLGLFECIHPQEFREELAELRIEWAGSIEWHHFLDNYLPGPQATVSALNQLLSSS